MVLYGVQRVFLQEIDPITKLPVVDGEFYVLKCAESVDLEPVIEEGEENILKCPSNNSVLGDRLEQDTFVGYDVTLTDNEWNPDVFALINGFEKITGDGGLDSLATPFIETGMNFKPFRMIIFAAAYEGKDIPRYVVFVLNNCTGKISPISLGQDWVQFEYDINCREATVAGFPVMSIGYYAGEEAPDTLDGITITAGVIQPGAPSGGEEETLRSVAPKGTTVAKVTKTETEK